MQEARDRLGLMPDWGARDRLGLMQEAMPD